MEIQVVSTYDDFLAQESVWENVLRQSRNDIVCLTHEWFRCWWRSFGGEKELLILLAREEGEVVGIAPLYLTTGLYRNLVKTKEIRFCVNSISPRVDFIVVKDKEKAVIEFMLNCLIDRCRSWDILRLEKIHTKSPTYEILKNALSNGRLRSRITESVKSPIICMDRSWEAFYADRSGKFRKGMRNKLNRVKRFGDIVIEKVEDRERLNDAFSVIYEVSRRSWKHDTGKSLPKYREQVTFYQQITESMGKRGWINIWLLKSGERCIAFEYHLIYNGIIHPIRADFDEAYKDISPGSFLEYSIIKAGFGNPNVQEYDFCGDDYKYMLNWTRSIREHVNVSVFNSRFVSKSVGWAECSLAPLVSKGIRFFARRHEEGRLCRR